MAKNLNSDDPYLRKALKNFRNLSRHKYYGIMKRIFVVPLFLTIACTNQDGQLSNNVGSNSTDSLEIIESPKQWTDTTSTINEDTIVNRNLGTPTFTKNTNPIVRKWEVIQDGLYFQQTKGPILSSINNSKLSILKISPRKFSITLKSAKELKSEFYTAPSWAKKFDFSAVVNAGMFQFDEYGTNTSYMKNYGFLNNPKLSNDNTIAAFNPKDSSVPPFQIIDRKCQNFDSLKTKYNTLIQGIRMMDCGQNITWSQQKKYWSTVCLGSDKSGNMLFIFTRSPFSVHDFVVNIKALVPDVYNLMYLEGGPEASFYINHSKKKIEMMGSYETDFNHTDDNDRFWDIPNVIGIKPIQ